RRSVRMIRTAISPRLATSTAGGSPVRQAGACPRGPVVVIVNLSSDTVGSHPEDAVAHGLQRCAAGGRQAQAEHGAGVRGVDHAVVPQPGGGVVGFALLLVLLADGRLEALLLLGAPLFAARGHLVAA